MQSKKVQPHVIEVLIHAWLLDQTLQGNWVDKPIGYKRRQIIIKPFINILFDYFYHYSEKGGIQSAGYNMSKLTDEQEHTQRYKVVEIINHPLFTRKYNFVELCRLFNFNNTCHLSQI